MTVYARSACAVMIWGAVLGLGLMGCTSGGDDYPALVPVDQLLEDTAPTTPDPAPALEARAAALRAQAQALRSATP